MVCCVVALTLANLAIPDLQVRADSLSLRVNKSEMKIGETVTVSITVPAGVSATINLTYPTNVFSFSSASETANANGGCVVMTLGGYGGTNTATTGTIKFKAKSAGTATFAASAPTAGNQEGDPVSIGGASCSVTVENEADEPEEPQKPEKPDNNTPDQGSQSNGGNSNSNSDSSDGGENATKSRDNSLAALTLSKGTLSPEFKYNVVNYTASVDYSVTSVVVSAKTGNAKATIESVTGGENLVVGENKITIVVKAENGVSATYTIKVTRNAQGESGTNPDGEADQEPDSNPVEPQEKCFVVNGKTLYPTSNTPEGWMQEGFSATEVELWGEKYPALEDTFYAGGIKLLYLQDANGENGGTYMVFAKQPYEAYDFVCLHGEQGFVIILPDGKGERLVGYTLGTAKVVATGEKLVEAWFYGSEKEFPLVFGVNQNGKTGWYYLDLSELTYMRYVELNRTVDEEKEPDADVVREPVQQVDSKTIEKLENKITLITGGAIIVIVILLIFIVMLLILSHGSSKNQEPLYEAAEEDGSATYMMESAKGGKWYDKEEFESKESEEPGQDVMESDEMISEVGSVEMADEQTDSPKEQREEALSADDSEKEGLSEAEETAAALALAKEIQRMSDVNPMGELNTHRDEDDVDLEYIDL